MLSDLRFAFRSLLKTPGFTAIALLTLALGIGVNTSMFSVLNSLLFHVPAYLEPERLVRVFRDSALLPNGPHSPASFDDMRRQLRSLRHVAAFNSSGASLAAPGRAAAQTPALIVTGDFFATLGVAPRLGRGLTPEDEQPGATRVVVLSEAIWQGQFSADPGVIGRTIRLNGEPTTVVGVMPAAFADELVWRRVGLWVPLGLSAEERQDRGGHSLNVIARLAPGVGLPAAQAELVGFFAQLARDFPETTAQTTAHLTPFVRSMQDGTVRLVSLFSLGLAVCVLLIACANLANLLFARHALHLRERAVRAALGASSFKLVSASLAESLLLAALGGGFGLLTTAWVNSALPSLLQIPGLTLAFDWRILAFAAALTLTTAFAFGLLPAILSARVDPQAALKQGTRNSSAGAHHRLRSALIVSEVALSLVLLSAAGFFLRGLHGSLQRDHGWRADHLLTGVLSLPAAQFPEKLLPLFYERFEERLNALPGVEQVALARSLPFRGTTWRQRYIVEGRALPVPGMEPMRQVNGVTPGFFKALRIDLREGRLLAATDLEGPPRMVIGESMARALWPGESAVGKRLAHPNAPDEWQEIVGVVRDVTFPANLADDQAGFQTYRLLAKEPSTRVAFAVRTSLPPGAMAETVRQAIVALTPDAALDALQPAETVIGTGLQHYRAVSWLLFGFALLGLFLAAIGTYGVIAGFVAQRTNEIGLRLALGAQLPEVLKLVLGQGLRLALIGTAIGLAGAWAVARTLRSIVPALSPPEWSTALAAAAILLLTSLVACLIPARRATKVDPIIALRAE